MPYAERRGVRLFWTSEGNGDPLLLIMGLGYSHDMWHRTRAALSAHFRLILFDNRGVGKSDAPQGPYTMVQMADDAAAVLDAAGLDSAHVFGVSMGGMIAQEFALRYPQRVRRLALGCTACGGPRAVRAERAVVDLLLNRANMAMEEAMEATVPFIYDPSTPRERIEEDFAHRRLVFPSPEGYSAQLAAVLGFESYSRLGGMTAPTLVIHGETDRLVPSGNGRLIADTIPGAQWELIPHASHLFITDQPERSHALIREFLADS
jgi:pimeloyl-ACP methyl ester carboxylesterase